MSTHPLDPLTPEELARAVEIVAQGSASWRAGCASSGSICEEPAKPHLLDGGSRPHRRGVRRHARQRPPGAAYEAIVDLRRPAASSAGRRWTGVQPAISADEFVEAAEAVRADPATARRWPAGADHRRRPRPVHIEPWSVGIVRDLRPAARRARLSWLRRRDDDVNPYARPTVRLVAVVDLNEMTRRPRRRPRRRADPARERRLPRRRGRPVSRRPEAAGDRAAGRAQLRAGRPRAAMAEVADADRLREPRGPGAPPDRVRGRRRAPLRLPPRVDR